MNREELVKNNLGLVHACCKRYTEKGIEYEDLYSTGCVGLVIAAQKFDEERGFKFSTYAVPVILGEIRRMFRDDGQIKVSRSVKELSLKVRRADERLSKDLGHKPTINEIAEYLEVSAESVGEAVCSSQYALSLTFENGDSEISEYDLPSIDENESTVDRIAVNEVLKTLCDNDRYLIILRYFKHKTQSETANLLGLTQVQVSRKEKKLLSVMKKRLE